MLRWGAEIQRAHGPRKPMVTVHRLRPRGFLPIGIFFIFGSTMAAYAALTLLWPGTALDVLWTLNKQAHAVLLPHAGIAGPLFLVLSAALAATAVGWLRRRHWGWLLGVVIVVINATGDMINLLRGERLKGALGVTIAGILFIYLIRPNVRRHFSRN